MDDTFCYPMGLMLQTAVSVRKDRNRAQNTTNNSDNHYQQQHCSPPETQDTLAQCSINNSDVQELQQRQHPSDAGHGETSSIASNPPQRPPTSPQSSTAQDTQGAACRTETEQRAAGSGNGTPNPEAGHDALRRRVRLLFMDHWSKFKVRRGKHFPLKLVVQIFKIGLITTQMCHFGLQRSEIVEFLDRTDVTLQHLLLKDWQTSYETMPYPPASGDFAVYTVNDLLDHVQYTWAQFYNLSETSLASINPVIDNSTGQAIPIQLCLRFNNYLDFPDGSYIVRPGVEAYCRELVPLEGPDKYNIRTFIRESNLTIIFAKLLDLKLSFTFTTFHLNLEKTHYGPTCFTGDATVMYENYKRSGQLRISLQTHSRERPCTGSILSQSVKDEERKAVDNEIALDAFVIIFCLVSFGLCVRSFLLTLKLLREVEKNYKKLGWSDRGQFFNFWLILIVVNDVCTVCAAILKILLETRAISSTSDNYNTCSMLLGLGGLMVWIGCLRYLEFFRSYGVLILTLKSALPNVCRFMLCALAMYLGFLFCGWLVLGPYHVKFRELSTTTDCLFALLNGDDMYVTFAATTTESQRLWYFSRVYLYTFISLFVFCVLSLFISVFTDTYERLKRYLSEGFPKTELQRFLETPDDDIPWTGCETSCCQKCKCTCSRRSTEAGEPSNTV